MKIQMFYVDTCICYWIISSLWGRGEETWSWEYLFIILTILILRRNRKSIGHFYLKKKETWNIQWLEEGKKKKWLKNKSYSSILKRSLLPIYTTTSAMKCCGILWILLYLENTSFIFTKVFCIFKKWVINI